MDPRHRETITKDPLNLVRPTPRHLGSAQARVPRDIHVANLWAAHAHVQHYMFKCISKNIIYIYINVIYVDDIYMYIFQDKSSIEVKLYSVNKS